jgi:ATP adenylyltransferase
VPEHSILITRTFKPQTHLLDAEDLVAAYACIRAYHDFPAGNGETEELFAFFNCGEHSGASQPHRHLQLLPITQMRHGLPLHQESAFDWVVLADLVAGVSIGDKSTGSHELPFIAYGERVLDPQQLHAAYLRLYRAACTAAGVETVDTAVGAEASISYNLAMTKDSIVIMPRTAEGAAVRDKQGNEVGRLALNGTVLAGTALVKTKAEWEALKDDPEQLLEILGQIGVPSRL